MLDNVKTTYKINLSTSNFASSMFPDRFWHFLVYSQEDADANVIQVVTREVL